ncbi:MAG: FxsA family protein [Myxococcales bacterium]|nr:FxsA family protein [Myxococcales bacterium]
MFTRLLLLFILVPLAEILLLIQIGDFIGFWPTLGLVLVTGVLGASLARDQGLQIIEQIRREFNQMNVPTDAMLEGLLVLIAGVVLLTPGVLTDLCGFLLLIPPLRRLIRDRIKRYVVRKIHERQIVVTPLGGARKAADDRPESRTGGRIIDVDAENE